MKPAKRTSEGIPKSFFASCLRFRAAEIGAAVCLVGVDVGPGEVPVHQIDVVKALKKALRQGQLHRLKTAIAEGKYIPADQAAEELAEFMAMFKKFAMNIPPRTVGTLAGYADALTIRTMEKAMRKELETMLTAFSDAAMEQRQEET